MTAITITQADYKKTVAALNETESFLAKHPASDLVESYKNHANALRVVLSEVNVVDRLTAEEGVKSASAVFNRIKALKAAK
jgi:hypothetical protein